MARRIYQVYIADGFADDCEELIDKCLKTETLTYSAFCDIWKEMSFAYVFQGRTTGAETAELSEELIHIAKHYMIANVSNIEESIAGLFLVYALLNLQPYPDFAALRLVPDDMEALKRIEVVARRERRYDVLYILGSVLVRGPCQFHIEERERGMEASIRKYLEGSKSIDKQGVRAKGVFYRQNDELDIIRELDGLSRRYKVAKSFINESKSMDPNLSYSNDKLPGELYSSLKKVINGIIDNNEEKDADIDSDGNGESSSDHYNTVQAIKSKAMKKTISPIKHLTALGERKRNPPNSKKQMDIKTKAGKIKSGSPTKPLASTLIRKRVAEKNVAATPKCKKVKTLESDDEKSPSTSKDLYDDLNVDEFVKGSNRQSKNPKEEGTDEHERANRQTHINTDAVPETTGTETVDQVERGDQLELCQRDKSTTKNKSKTCTKKSSTLKASTKKQSIQPKSHSTEITDSTENNIGQEENIIMDAKKPKLKSKFKRLGMLPIANFEESE